MGSPAPDAADPLYFYKRNSSVFGSTREDWAAKVGHMGPSPARLSSARKLIELFKSVFEILRSRGAPLVFFDLAERTVPGPSGPESLYGPRILARSGGALVIVLSSPQWHRPLGARGLFDWTALDRLIWLWLRVRRNGAGPSEHSRRLFEVRARVMGWILGWIEPKLVLATVWNGKEWAIRAAKDRGIKVVDIQHGRIHSAPTEANLYRLDGIPLDSSAANLLPDEVWVYGDYWKRHLLRLGWSDDRVKVAGYFLNLPFEQLRDSSERANGVLLVSSPSYEKDLVQAARLVPAGFKTILACHPNIVGDADYFRRELGDSVEIRRSSTYDSMRECGVVVAPFSTLLIEALAFGRAPWFFGKEIPPDFAELIERGWIRKFETSKEFDPEWRPNLTSRQIEDFFAPFRGMD